MRPEPSSDGAVSDASEPFLVGGAVNGGAISDGAVGSDGGSRDGAAGSDGGGSVGTCSAGTPHQASPNCMTTCAKNGANARSVPRRTHAYLGDEWRRRDRLRGPCKAGMLILRLVRVSVPVVGDAI